MAVRTDRLYDHHLDLTQHELRNAVLENRATAPVSPVRGQQYFDTAMLAHRIWDGTQWLTVMTTPRPCLHVNRDGAAGPNLAVNTFQKINYNNIVVDVAGSYSVATATYTIPVSGLYLLTHSVHSNNVISGPRDAYMSSNIYVNGSIRLAAGQAGHGGIAMSGVLCSGVLELSVGDQIEFYWRHSGNPATCNYSGANISQYAMINFLN